MSTTRVAPTPRGSGLVQATLVMTVAQCGQDSASARTSNSCSGVIARSTLLLNRFGAVRRKSRSTRSQGNVQDTGDAFLASISARRAPASRPGSSVDAVAAGHYPADNRCGVTACALDESTPAGQQVICHPGGMKRQRVHVDHVDVGLLANLDRSAVGQAEKPGHKTAGSLRLREPGIFCNRMLPRR
jgi:hypothetical protein